MPKLGRILEKFDGKSVSCKKGWFKELCKPTKKMSDFSKYTEREMLEFEDACCLCNLAYFPSEVVKAVDECTKAQIDDPQWRVKNIYLKKPGDIVFDKLEVHFWENVFNYLHKPDIVWKLIDVKKYDTQVYIFCDSERLVIAWRGTESVKDALIDLRFRQIDWPFNKNVHGMVHKGFATAYGSARDLVKKQCLEFINLKKPKMINITGHSLGAGLCAINSIDFTEDPIAKGLPIYAVSVAMPPTVSPQFKELVSRICPNFTNLTNEKDPLVWVRTITNLITVGRDLWLKLNDKTGRMAAHSVEKYIAQIEQSRQHLKEIGKSFAKARATKKARHFNFLQRNLVDAADNLDVRRAERLFDMLDDYLQEKI